MDTKESRMKTLYHVGYQQGMYDRDHQNSYMCGQSDELGSLYLQGYKQGYEDAKDTRWHIVSLKKDGSISHWYYRKNDKSMNKWVGTKEEATAFATETIVREKYIQLTNTVGRGTYNYVRRKQTYNKIEPKYGWINPCLTPEEADVIISL